MGHFRAIFPGPIMLLAAFSLEELGRRQIEVVAARSLHPNPGHRGRVDKGEKRCHCQLHHEESQDPQCLRLQVHLLRVPQPRQCHWSDVPDGRLLQWIFQYLRFRSSVSIQHTTRETF